MAHCPAGLNGDFRFTPACACRVYAIPSYEGTIYIAINRYEAVVDSAFRS